MCHLWHKVKLTTLKQITPYNFNYRFTLENCKVNQDLFPLQYIKLGLFKSDTNQLQDERYYSIFNNTFNYEGRENQKNKYFDCYIKDNPLLPNKELSFPFKVRNLDQEHYIAVSYPYGDIYYEGEKIITTIKDKKDNVKVNHLFLIAAGTGIVPMIQLLKAFNYEKEADSSFPKCNIIYSDSIVKPYFYDDLVFYISNICDISNLYFSVDDYHYDISNLILNLRKSLLINEDEISYNSPDVMFVVCGPKEMNKEVTRILIEDYKIKYNQIKLF